MSTSSPALPVHALDLRQIARAGETLKGEVSLDSLSRWQEGAPEWREPQGARPLVLSWEAHVDIRQPAGGKEQVWLHLCFDGHVPQICQRCLTVYLEPIAVDRWFRFVPDEATAEAQDDESEEDLLVWTPRFNLLELIEDELLLALPIVPMHEACPESLPNEVEDDGFHPEKPHAFAALSALKLGLADVGTKGKT